MLKLIIKTTLLATTLLGTEVYAKVAYTGASSPLAKFNDCGAMQAHMNRYFYSASHNEWKKSQDNKKETRVPQSSLGSSGPTESARAKAAPTKDSSMTGTNNQVAGVEESDFIKTDGDYFYHVSGTTLRIVKSWPANQMDVVATYELTSPATDIQITDNFLAVFGGSAVYGGKVEIAILDISNKRVIKEHARFRIPGALVTSRLHNGKLRVVLTDYSASIVASAATKPKKTPKGQWQTNGWSRWGRETPETEYSFALNIQNAELVTKSRTETLETVQNCRNVYLPEQHPGNQLTRIVTINFSDRSYAEDFAFTRADHVYASENTLYLASQLYGGTETGFYENTRIDAFRLDHATQAPLSASGLVGGRLLNQFAMDEHDGVLRVAMTGSRNGHKNQWFPRQTGQINFVQTLKRQGAAWKVLGSTEDLAAGERIYAVRFDGDQGYVVTFRQVDPLYTIDLSNPNRPSMLGELKVPGYSTYIHMLDKNHLLAIGQDADPNTGRAKGLKLSVFDVSNRKKPREVESLLFKGNATSEASLDHKAFTFYRERGILAIPANMTDESTGKLASLLLFKVTTDRIDPMGELDMSDMAPATGDFSQRQAGVEVRRSFFREDVVFAAGAVGIRAARITDLIHPLRTLDFSKTLTSQIGGKRSW